MKPLTFLFTFLPIIALHSQTISRSSIDSGGASSSSGNIELLYTIGEVAIQESSVNGTKLSEGFINSDFRVLILPRVFLQGPMLNPATAGLMNDDLRSGGHLPTTSPYADAATAATTVFNQGGTSGSGLAADDIVDWVWIELRASNDNTNRINGRSALLQRDGDIVDLDGVSNVKMQAAPTSYYVVIQHRNHLGVMSANTFGLKEASNTTLDFKQNTLATYGSNAQAQLTSGDMALWAGVTDGSGKIKFSGANNGTNIIKDAVLAHPSNIFNSLGYSVTGYLLYDINMNGQGKFSGAGNDANIIKDNVLAHPSNIFNSLGYTINKTVPNNN